MILDSEDAEKEALLNVARLMVVAARTAPKARGEDSIKAVPWRVSANRRKST